MSAQKTAGQNSGRRIRARVGNGTNAGASSNGAADSPETRCQTDASTESPRHCDCYRKVPVDVALRIICIVKGLPLPEEVLPVHPLNPTGALLNLLREARVKLVDRAALVHEMIDRQLSGGPGNGQPIACADVRSFVADLQIACDLAFGWWNTLGCAAVALERVSELRAKDSTELDQLHDWLQKLDPQMEELSRLTKKLPPIASRTGPLDDLLREMGIGGMGDISIILDTASGMSPPFGFGAGRPQS